MSNLAFFDNPPNFRSQKKTGLAETYSNVSNSNQQPLSNISGNSINQSGNKNINLQEDYIKYPTFNKNLSGKISLIIGRKNVGKTDLAKQLITNLLGEMSEATILKDFDRISIVTSHQNEEYKDLTKTLNFKNTNFEVISTFQNLIENSKDQEYNNSLIVIEDDINIDDKNKDLSDVKQFFDFARHYQITVVIVRQNLGNLPSIISSVIDYLFIFCGAIYADLQKLHSRFLPQIGFGNFYRIYRDMMTNHGVICVIDLVIPARSKKDNKKKWNLINSFYKYYLDECSDESEEVSSDNSDNLQLRQLILTPISSPAFKKGSFGKNKNWRNTTTSIGFPVNTNDDLGQGYTHFSPIEDQNTSQTSNSSGRGSRIGKRSEKIDKEEFKDRLRLKINQVNDLLQDIKNELRL